MLVSRCCSTPILPFITHAFSSLYFIFLVCRCTSSRVLNEVSSIRLFSTTSSGSGALERMERPANIGRLSTVLSEQVLWLRVKLQLGVPLRSTEGSFLVDW